MSSAWVLGLALGAGYLVNKKMILAQQLDTAIAEHRKTEESSDELSGLLIHKAQSSKKHEKYGDMNQSLPQKDKDALLISQQESLSNVAAFESPEPVKIQGVWLESFAA